MAQLTIRNLEESVKRKLKWRAARYGRTMEEEVRLILRDAVKFENYARKRRVAKTPTKGRGTEIAGTHQPRKGLGTAMAERFKGIELEDPLPDMKIELQVLRFEG